MIRMATFHPYELCYLLIGYFRMEPQQRKYWIEDGRPIENLHPNNEEKKEVAAAAAAAGSGMK